MKCEGMCICDMKRHAAEMGRPWAVIYYTRVLLSRIYGCQFEVFAAFELLMT